MPGRTMTLIHKGDRIVVVEGQNGELEFRQGRHRATPTSKTFEAATNEARKHLLATAGGTKGNYRRDTT